MKKSLIALLLMLTGVASAQTRPLVVDVSPFAPCVNRENGALTGFEVELWEAIARDAGLAFNYSQTDDDAIFADLKAGQADVGFSGLTITAEREAGLDFSQHTLDSGLQILVPERHVAKKLSVLSFFRMFGRSLSTPAVIEFAVCLALFHILAAHILWLVERNHGIQKKYLAGIFEAIYFCIVTSSTVGYGDITAKKVAGRLCAILLIMTGIAWFSNFTALLAANYTAEKLNYSITCPADLRGKLVGTQAKTTSVAALDKLGARVAAFPTIDEAYDRLGTGELDAVVYDFPNVKNFVKTRGDGKVVAVGGVFNIQYYGFAFPQNSPLLRKVNLSLLKLREDGTYARLYQRWFGNQ